MRILPLLAVLACALAGCSSSPVHTVALANDEVSDCSKPGAPTGSHIISKNSCESSDDLVIMSPAAYERAIRQSNKN